MFNSMLTYFHWWWIAVQTAWWTFRVGASERAFIWIRQGMYYFCELGHRIYTGKLGEIYAYADDGIVYVYTEKIANDSTRENRDAVEDYEGERIIYVVDGEVIGAPLKGTGKQMDASILSEFNRGDFVYQMQGSYRTASKGIQWGSMRWLFLIAVIAIILLVVWKFVLHGHMPGTPVVTPTPTPTPQPTSTPLYGLLQWAAWVVSNA